MANNGTALEQYYLFYQTIQPTVDLGGELIVKHNKHRTRTYEKLSGALNTS
jgi:hypothetical protein